MSWKHTTYTINSSKQQLVKNLKISFASPSKSTDEKEKEKEKEKRKKNKKGNCKTLCITQKRNYEPTEDIISRDKWRWLQMQT